MTYLGWSHSGRTAGRLTGGFDANRWLTPDLFVFICIPSQYKGLGKPLMAWGNSHRKSSRFQGPNNKRFTSLITDRPGGRFLLAGKLGRALGSRRRGKGRRTVLLPYTTAWVKQWLFFLCGGNLVVGMKPHGCLVVESKWLDFAWLPRAVGRKYLGIPAQRLHCPAHLSAKGRYFWLANGPWGKRPGLGSGVSWDSPWQPE